ncbi:hypothetical protein [Lichenibacterium dinghuense]|uniref:hypothetical protein n=1 Tax=Lichenibacterium dinghuense TaxID=2895977 RepID=UPI001F417158|nr:hypothetical protein [Lichenibacterium sp. 6Y81]
MSKHIAFLSAALLAGSVLPAAAADYYGGYDGGDRPLSYHSRDDVYLDGGRARIEHRQDLGPAEGYRRAPGPVVFDERGPERRFDGYGYGGPGFRRPVAAEGFGYGRPPAFIPRADRPIGGAFGYGGGYRPAAVAVGPVEGEGYGAGYGGPDEGCTVERARSITPAGWEKTVTHRTCYRR